MPVHDWLRVDAGLFHHFHQQWIVGVCNSLNTGGLPDGYYVLCEQDDGETDSDFLTLQNGDRVLDRAGGLSLVTTPIKTRFTFRAEPDAYARKANRATIRNRDHTLIAVLEIVSPGNKSTTNALRKFVEKAAAFLRQGVHLLIVDLLPPSKRDPQGIHKAIWDEIAEEPFELPADKPLTLAAYSAGMVIVAYVEPVAVGDRLPDMPLFLEPETYVMCPLEETYSAVWSAFPKELKRELEG